MSTSNTLTLAISDLIGDKEVNPSFVPLALLGQFQSEVSDFIRGQTNEVDTKDVVVSLEDGSLAFVVHGLFAATLLWSDVATVNNGGSLDSIDHVRAKILQKWQTESKKKNTRSYKIFNTSEKLNISINSSSNLLLQQSEDWVVIERYISGTVQDMGGSAKPNIHLKLESGEKLVISSEIQQIADEKKNHLYKEAMLHVKADQNLKTKELKSIRLLKFVDFSRDASEFDFDAMIRKGTKAWEDVPDGSDWLEKIRGKEA